jgi:hypothetical protein
MAGKISGFASLDGTPIQTTVRIYESVTGLLVDTVQSGADGLYESVAGNELAVYVMADPPPGYAPICHGPLTPVLVEVDIHSDSVTSLIHFDWLGHNKIVNDEVDRNTLSVIGSASIIQSDSKFGGGCLQCATDGGVKIAYNHYLTIPTDTTIEAWVYIPAVPVAKSSDVFPIIALGKLSSSASNLGTGLYLKKISGGYSLNLKSYYNSSNSYTHTSSTFALSTGWHHVAWSRAGATSYMFINGSSVGTKAMTANPTNYNQHDITVGYAVRSNFYGPVGYAGNHAIDELRVTRGVARYIEDFIPREFPFAYTPS